jgi:hypothetical protein
VGVGAQTAGDFSHFVAGRSKSCSIGSTQIEHLQSFTFNARFFQQYFSSFYPGFGSLISFQEMASAFLSAGYEGGVSSIFKSLQELQSFHTAAAHQSDYSHIRRILQTHRTGGIGCGIGTVMAAESNHFRFVSFIHFSSFIRLGHAKNIALAIDLVFRIML